MIACTPSDTSCPYCNDYEDAMAEAPAEWVQWPIAEGENPYNFQEVPV